MMQKLPILIAIVSLGLNVWSCSKDKENSDNEVPMPVDYSIKFEGKYLCKGQYSFYHLDTVRKDTSLIVYVVYEDGTDSTVRSFYSESFTVKCDVEKNGVFGKVPGSWFGYFAGDSIYIYFFCAGHFGDTEWVLAGKRK